ncbi:OmpA family protein [Tateyamaria omphalii]|uniref:OmpA family protein n=1 Tax=Tateyamaria omphalii TaxID=299262 RepID=UPI001C99DEB2|nr:OmpA family protein [Tateyamaria omphalii]MBY5933807.1 OmpA family protein [Tateyamaria omphalii]
MALKYLRDSLPWLVPSAAIVFAASGFLELGGTEEAAEPQPVAAAVPQPAPVAPQPVSAQIVDTALPADQEVVARQVSPETSLTAVAPVAPQAQPVTAAAPAPAPKPVATPAPQRTASLAATPVAPFFDTNTFGAGAQQQCIDDLRTMADQARVYFPSGGLTADQGGIEQGRLLGLIAQNCQGVQIRVEGHSDPSGDPAANLRLSQARAEEVIKRIGASGIDTRMFVAQGMGDRQPSGIVGPEPASYYDRRVEFSLVEEVTRVAVRVPTATPKPWANATCVTALQQAVDSTMLFYAPRSVSLGSSDVDTAMTLAMMAMECPHARLRVIGHHAGDVGSGEGVSTGLLRAKALMAMLVGRGVNAEEIIIAAPSRPLNDAGLPGSRVRFDVILEEG